MSRSYKHVPCYKDHNRGMKKCSNRKIRRNYFIILSGMAYKKLFYSYEICDYKFIRSFASYKKIFSENNRIMYSNKEFYRMWYKDYKMK